MLAIALTQAPPGARTQALANDREQAALVIDSVRQFVSLTPGLASVVDVSDFRAKVISAGGNRVTIDAIAADQASTWGGRPYVLVVDEIGQAPSTTRARGVFTAAFSAIAKVAGLAPCRHDERARAVALVHRCDARRYCRRGLVASQQSWSPGVPLSWVEPELLEAQRGLLTESEFARLHLNLSVASEDRLVDPERVLAMITAL